MLDVDAGDRDNEKDNTSVNPRESTRVTRKFINSAIYVEKPLSSTLSVENISSSRKFSNEDLLETKTKRCTCSTDQKTCPCHANSFFTFIPKETRKSLFNFASAVTLKVSEHKTKVSQSVGKYNLNSGDEHIKKWIAKKEDEKRKKEAAAKRKLEAQRKEQEMLLEQKRNHFKQWLANKKKLETEAKKKQEKKLEEQQLKELEKEKRQLENQLNFQLWLRKKEEVTLEKKIKEQIDLIDDLERKEKQFKENQKAFSDWLKNSKNRQKPTPLNKGIESMCSATSVSYVNPHPWKSMP